MKMKVSGGRERRLRLRGCAVDRSQTGEKSRREKAVAGHRDIRKERERSAKWVGEADKKRRKQTRVAPRLVLGLA